MTDGGRVSTATRRILLCMDRIPDMSFFFRRHIEFPLAIVGFPLGGHENGTKKQRKRAKLIAAAPELLKACQEALKYVSVEEPAYDVLCDAIKKATE